MSKHRMTRRSFIRIAGTSAVIVGAGNSLGTYVLTRTHTQALTPWKRAGKKHPDPRMRALSYAILAPTPHNRQPWLIDLSTKDQITLYCDPERLLPHTDPFNRQIVIGLGCFLELLQIAAAEAGYNAEITPFPEGDSESQVDGRPVAQIQFDQSESVSPDPLFQNILNRRSTKEPFDTSKPLEVSVLETLTTAGQAYSTVQTTQDPQQVQQLRDLSWNAHVIEVQTPRTNQESIDLMRFGKTEIEANPDGIDMGGVMLETLNRIGLFTRKSLADPNSMGYKQGLVLYEEIHQTSMAYLWLVTDTNSRADQLAAGRAWVRINLEATAQGVSIHPVSQALQEYDEMQTTYDQLHQMLEVNGDRRLQMFARLGYAPQVPPSPRWRLETRIFAPSTSR